MKSLENELLINSYYLTTNKYVIRSSYFIYFDSGFIACHVVIPTIFDSINSRVIQALTVFYIRHKLQLNMALNPRVVSIVAGGILVLTWIFYIVANAVPQW